MGAAEVGTSAGPGIDEGDPAAAAGTASASGMHKLIGRVWLKVRARGNLTGADRGSVGADLLKGSFARLNDPLIQVD